MRQIIFSLLLLAAPTCARAEATNVVTGAEISQVGIFKAAVVKQSNAQGGWKTDGASNVSWVQSTTNIPGRVGMQFGFRYNIKGSPTNAPITVQVAHEQPQLKDAKTGATVARNVSQIQSRIGQSYLLYTLEDADLIPGKWKFQVLYEGRLLCEQGFVVNNPTYRPPLRSVTNSVLKPKS